MEFNLKDHEEWVNNYRKIWKAVEEQLFVNLQVKPLKEECHLNAKLNVYKDKIRTRFSWGRDSVQSVLQSNCSTQS